MNSPIKNLITGILVVFSLSLNAQPQQGLRTFELRDVKLLNGIFKDAQETDLRYMKQLVPDRLLAPYLREAGLRPKAASYTNWENTGLDGHIGGHYLSALAMMYASTGDKDLLARLNYMLSELKECQDKNENGYIGGVPGSRVFWSSVMKGDIDVFNKKWVPLYNIHKTFAGIRDAYLYSGNETAKVMLLKFADWFVQLSTALDETKMQEMLQTEHGGINEVLADVYAISGDKKYLNAAYHFSHQALLEPLEEKQDKLNNLHANTQIPKVIGFERIAAVHRDSNYYNAARFFWETVVNRRTVAIGGNSVREHFNPAYDFSSMMTSEQGPETCNTYNMLKLTEGLYLADPKISYIDYYERALYNHILITQRAGKGGFVYFTPMRAGHYRVYSQPETGMWCCVGSGMENHSKYGKMIYAHDEQNLFINLFIPSQLTWKEKGLKITQETNFPETERTTITVNQVNQPLFAINIRYPSWVRSQGLQIRVNDKPCEITGKPSSYVSIKRAWKKGDVITVFLPMTNTVERLPDGSDYEAVVHGPIVLAAMIDTTDMPGLLADDSRMGHVAQGRQLPLKDMPFFVNGKNDDTTFIRQVPDKPLTFTAPKLIFPAKYSGLQLVPFYKIHDARYIVYWQKKSPQSIAAGENQALKEENETYLATKTIDLVTPGEQQPENDHAMESEHSNTGINLDRHWRAALGWFSYTLTDKAREAGALLITYNGSDAGKSFSILVNDKLIANEALNENLGNLLYTKQYVIPEDIRRSSKGSLKVKFKATGGKATGCIYEIRLLKN